MHKKTDYRGTDVRFTLDIVGVVNDEISIPHNREVHRQVADVISFIVILERDKEKEKDTILCCSSHLMFYKCFVQYETPSSKNPVKAKSHRRLCFTTENRCKQVLINTFY